MFRCSSVVSPKNELAGMFPGACRLQVRNGLKLITPLLPVSGRAVSRDI